MISPQRKKQNVITFSESAITYEILQHRSKLRQDSSYHRNPLMNLSSCWIGEALSDDYLMKTFWSPSKGAMTNGNFDWLTAYVRRVRSLP